MSLDFQILHATETAGRRATLSLPHGTIQTPVFMPVGTAATVKAVEQGVVESLGAEIILANTYHLYLRPGHDLIARLGGVHKFMSWNRPMLTDSGGFQVFSLAKLRSITQQGVEFRSHLDGSKHFFSPEHSIAVQIALGADIIMVFDECVETPASWERTRDSLALTHAWAQRSKQYWLDHRHEVPWAQEPATQEPATPWSQDPATPWSQDPATPWSQDPATIDKSDTSCHPEQSRGASEGPASPALPQTLAGRHQSLFGIVQGGMYADLRIDSARMLVDMDLPGYAIGGLAVGEAREVTREMIALTLEHLPKDKPRYVMGVGYPDEIEEYARMGVDMMDCVLPTRAGRHGLCFIREDPGDRASKVVRFNVKRQDNTEDQRPLDEGCTCMVCRRYTRAYLRHLFAAGEPLGATLNSIHNLAFYMETMQRVRDDLAASNS